MKTLTLYTTPQCRFCVQLKDYLQSRSLAFTEFNVVEEPDRLDEMKQFSGGGLTVPVVVVNRNMPDQFVFVGFQPDALDKVLSES